MIEAISRVRCEIVVQVSIAAVGRMQCPNPAVGFWTRGKGIWTPTCLSHLEAIQAANLGARMRYAPIEQPVEPGVGASDAASPTPGVEGSTG